MAETRRLNYLVSAAKASLVLPEGRLTVALSGGADSAALAWIVLDSGRDSGLVHVDHGLEASPMMANAAHDIAGQLGLPLQVTEVNVGAGPSLEERARDARYRALSGTEGPVVTGHTRDDSVETVLINLTRGTGPAGLSGIPRFRPPNIYRPILGVTRDETREIATLAGLPYVDDPMNADMSLTRNRIRLQILPLLRQLNPQVEAALARTSEMLERDMGHLDELAKPFYLRPLPVSVVTTLPKVLADRVLHDALDAAGIGVTADRIGRMWSVASGESPRQDLAEGRTVVRRDALLVIE